MESESIEEMLKDRKSFCRGYRTGRVRISFAYFPANNSIPSVIAEMLTAALGAQCMKWETSPAAAELEEKMMEWLRKLTGLPEGWDGVIQDSASSSTLAAILSAREKYSNYSINEHGFRNENFRVYCSSEAHSSVEKAVKIAGLGRNNSGKSGCRRHIPDDPQCA
ncbi:MAG: pyridoxal-dependent decarboxylase [Bacteroidales bacterium]